MEHNNKNRIVSERLREEALDLALFEQAKIYAFDYMRNILNQDVFPGRKALEGLNIFQQPLQVESSNPYEILDSLHNNGSPATVAQTGGRYFGFVNGGIVPAAEILEQVNETRRPVYVTQNGEARAVLVDTESYENMKKAIGLLKLLTQGESDIVDGKILSQEDFFSGLDRELDNYDFKP